MKGADYLLSLFEVENPGPLCHKCWTISNFDEEHICEPKLRLYLAHSFNLRKNIRNWELDFEKRTGIELVNPFYDIKNRQTAEKQAIRSEATNWRKIYPIKRLDEKKLVITDIRNMIYSDGVVAVLGKDSYGTPMEMVYAKLWGRNVYTWARNGGENHPWIKFHSDYLTSRLGDLEIKLIEVRNNKLK